MAQSSTTVGNTPSAVARLIIPSSFFATAESSVTVKVGERIPLAEFHLNPGAWIIQAKATVNGQGGTTLDSTVSTALLLVAQAGNLTAQDEAIVDPTLHQVSVATIGLEAPTPILLQLFATNRGGGLGGANSNFSDIKIVAAKQAELITLAF